MWRLRAFSSQHNGPCELSDDHEDYWEDASVSLNPSLHEALDDDADRTRPERTERSTKQALRPWDTTRWNHTQTHTFPPPIAPHATILYRRSAGRLVLQEVNSGPQSFFKAERQGGRLRLLQLLEDNPVSEENDNPVYSIADAFADRTVVPDKEIPDSDEADEASICYCNDADEGENVFSDYAYHSCDEGEADGKEDTLFPNCQQSPKCDDAVSIKAVKRSCIADSASSVESMLNRDGTLPLSSASCDVGLVSETAEELHTSSHKSDATTEANGFHVDVNVNGKMGPHCPSRSLPCPSTATQLQFLPASPRKSLPTLVEFVGERVTAESSAGSGAVLIGDSAGCRDQLLYAREGQHVWAVSNGSRRDSFTFLYTLSSISTRCPGLAVM